MPRVLNRRRGFGEPEGRRTAETAQAFDAQQRAPDRQDICGGLITIAVECISYVSFSLGDPRLLQTLPRAVWGCGSYPRLRHPGCQGSGSPAG